MDIARLLKKRQLNVQEQNALSAHHFTTCAQHWRQQGLPAALLEAGAARGIQWEKSILLRLELDFPGMPSLSGQLIDQGGRFIEFELESDPDHCQLLSVEQWQDISAQQNLARHVKGIGQGQGAIALDVWRALTACRVRPPYKAAFVLALGTKKVLGDSGWEFEALKPIAPQVAQHFVHRLHLAAQDTYLGIEVFSGEDMQLSVLHDQDFGIEQVDFKTYSDTALAAVTHAWRTEPTGSTELFVPSLDLQKD